ncbi:MAG TPA: hypothetical protein VGK30_00225 [Candidatus Binatia bacterium]|jgi:hypothetical protein
MRAPRTLAVVGVTLSLALSVAGCSLLLCAFQPMTCVQGLQAASRMPAPPRGALALRSSLPAIILETYAMPPNTSLTLSDTTAGLPSSQTLLFDVVMGGLETFEGTVTYPAGFEFLGFPPVKDQQIGFYVLRQGATPIGPPIPIRSLAYPFAPTEIAYADLDADGTFGDADFGINHGTTLGGEHTFTFTMPLGGDGQMSTIFAALDLKAEVHLYGGILRNPVTPGPQMVEGDFTSVDPDTDGDDDAAGVAPSHLSATPQTVTIDPSPLAMLDPFLCYKGKLTGGKLCEAGSPANAGVACTVEEDCGGTTGTTRHCIPNKPLKGAHRVLDDAFGDRDYAVGKPLTLCNPAGVDGATILDATTHLRAYATKPAKKICSLGSSQNELGACAKDADCGNGACAAPPAIAACPVELVNALGSVAVAITKVGSVLAPSGAAVGAPAAAPGANEVDYYNCYGVKPLKKVCVEAPDATCHTDADCGDTAPCVAGFPKSLHVGVSDELTTDRGLQIVKPTRICLAAAVHGQAVKHAGADLLCYQVKALKKRCVGSLQNLGGPCKGEPDCGGSPGVTNLCLAQPKRTPTTGVHVTSPFALEILDESDEQELCVPTVFATTC